MSLSAFSHNAMYSIFTQSNALYENAPHRIECLVIEWSVQCAHCLCFSIHISRLLNPNIASYALTTNRMRSGDLATWMKFVLIVQYKSILRASHQQQQQQQLLYLSDDKGNVSALHKQAIQLQTECVSVQFELVTSSYGSVKFMDVSIWDGVVHTRSCNLRYLSKWFHSFFFYGDNQHEFRIKKSE